MEFVCLIFYSNARRQLPQVILVSVVVSLVLRVKSLKHCLLPSLVIFSSKPGVGQKIALHPSPAAMNDFMANFTANFYHPCSFNFVPTPLSSFLAVGYCGRRN